MRCSILWRRITSTANCPFAVNLSINLLPLSGQSDSYATQSRLIPQPSVIRRSSASYWDNYAQKLIPRDIIVKMVHEMHHGLNQANIKIGNINDRFNTFLYPFSSSFVYSRERTYLPLTAKLFDEILRMAGKTFVDCKFFIPATYDCVGDILVFVEPEWQWLYARAIQVTMDQPF